MAVRVQEQTFYGLTPGKVGVWWFLASEIMMFGGFIASYVVFRLGAPGWAESARHLNVTIGIVNTLILLTSSLTIVLALAATERGDEAALRRFLGLTILLGCAFLGFKAIEYTGELRAGYAPWTLGSHTVLAAALVVLVPITLYCAVRARFDRHARLARWTVPIGLYVSVTGVGIYLMLYRLF